MVCFPFSVSATHVRCQCRINPCCVKSDEFKPGYQSRCVCIQKGQLCRPSCKCRNCSNQDVNNDFGKPVSCMCGSTKKDDHYVACTNYEGQLRATKCKCFKNKVGCNSNCCCKGCGNDYGKNLTTGKSQSPSMKRAKREDYKYCKVRSSNFREEKTGDKASGIWTLLEVVVLYYSVQISQRMVIELDVKQIAELYNLISGSSDLNTNQFSVRRKSETQIKSKLEHLQKY